MDAGEFVFHLEKENISELIENILNRYYKKEINSGELKFILEENIIALVDINVFPSIITNLIDNAVKYSPNQKEIIVELLSEKNAILLQVTDKGVGILNDDKEKIFNKFYRAGNEGTRTTKGTGLGLYIVKYILKNHNATISLKNNLPVGSIFEIRFDVA